MTSTNKGNTILLTVIAIATFLVALVGATFAYFTATVKGNDQAKSIIIKTAQIGTVTFNTTNELKLENAYPGATSNTVTFTVAADANSSVNVNYTLKWAELVNDFVGTDLVYTLTGESTNATDASLVTAQNEVVVPTAAGIIGSGVLRPGETHTYSLTVKFKETGLDQNANQGKTFNGKIEVTTGDTDTYYNDANKSGTTTKPTAPTTGEEVTE